MSKLSRWIVLSITVGIVVAILNIVLATFGYKMEGSTAVGLTPAGIAIMVILILTGICEIIGSILIWTKKSIPDVTIDKPSK